MEFVVRQALIETQQSLAGLYDGNPKRKTARPSAEQMLQAFCDLTLYFLPDSTIFITPIKGLPKNKLFQEKQEICFFKNDNHFKGEKRGCRGQPLFSPSSMHEESIHLSSILKLNSVGLVCFVAK